MMQAFEFDFGQLIVLKEDHIVIGRMAKETVVNEDIVCKINDLANSIYMGEPWIYISDRVSSYSVDPMLYQKVFDIKENMAGFIVVAYRPMTKKVAEIENSFKSKKYEFVVCSSLSEATNEARKRLAQFRSG